MKQEQVEINFEYEGDDVATVNNRNFAPHTIGWWLLEELNEADADDAILNCMNGHNNLDRACDSVYDAIDRAFTWEESPQGHGYWENIRDEFYPVVDDEDEYEDYDDESDE